MGARFTGGVTLADLGTAIASLPIDGVVNTNGRIGNPVVVPSLRPRIQRPTPNISRRVTDFQSGHGWAKISSGTGSTGTVSDDTSVFVQGSQSLKTVTSGAAQFTIIKSAAISPTLDLTTNLLIVKLRVDLWARLNTLNVGVSSDLEVTTGSGSALLSTASTIAQDGDWVTLAVNTSDMVVDGGKSAPNMAAINMVTLTAKDQGTGAVTVNWQSVDAAPLPANGCICLLFDDGFKTTSTVAKPYLDRSGLRAGVFPIRDQITAVGTSGLYMDISMLKALHDDSGWDIGCHADTIAAHNAATGMLSLSTTDGSTTKPSSFELEIIRWKMWAEANRFRGADFMAWPLGSFDQAHTDIARKYFVGLRTFRSAIAPTDADFYPFSDVSRLRGMAVVNGASPSSAASVNTAIDTCMTGKHTLLLTFHNLSNSAGGSDYPIASFQTVIDHIVSSGYKVKTLSEVFREGVA